MEFQSTPPVKAATMRSSYHFRIYAISIHAAREGGDCLPWFCGLVIVISIHAAREGGDSASAAAAFALFVFQSTPPVKAATSVCHVSFPPYYYFNPRRP